MGKNYNRVPNGKPSFDNMSRELTWLVNKAAAIWAVFMTIVSFIIGVLCLCGILPNAALWSLLWSVPAGFSILALLYYYNRKARQLLRRQQLSVMAYHAKQILNSLQQQMPDTLVSDSRIRMRYLARHGIDVDAALMRLGNNVEKYNELALAFLRESGRCEDVLYDLMRPETLGQYGTHARSLRVRANELGIIKLTDTAFFHEIEAYAGCFGIVRANWEKLACDIDEACTLLDEYTKSLGLKDDAVDNDGNRMTFRKWSDRLQDAFRALEAYDPGTAKKILNELVKYQIDSDITSSLKNIITNIDETMA